MAITQNIGIIPEAGHRGIDAREAFVTKQEAFQDHLTDTFVTEINTLKTQINNEVDTLNGNLATATNTAVANATLAASNSAIGAGISASTATQKATEASSSALSASGSATTASTKASEANVSANNALTYKNQLQGYVIPAGTSYSVGQINTQNSAMTKAQFNALADERKANRAGSGFDEFGKHITDSVYPKVNEGIFTGNSFSNYFRIGYSGTSAVGTSKSEYPIVNINGVTQSLSFTSINAIGVGVVLPQAPNIYPHDTVLTPEQIASGVIKHADASNSGLIVNGKFDTDTSGWTGSRSALSVTSGTLVVTGTATVPANQMAVSTYMTLVVGKKYIFEAEIIAVSSSTGFFITGLTFDVNGLSYVYPNKVGKYTYIVTATANSGAIALHAGNLVGATATFGNIAVYPADAISRSDLVFLELTTSNAA